MLPERADTRIHGSAADVSIFRPLPALATAQLRHRKGRHVPTYYEEIAMLKSLQPLDRLKGRKRYNGRRETGDRPFVS
jgi:hypothetical protein